MKKVRIIPLILFLGACSLAVIAFWMNPTKEEIKQALCFYLGGVLAPVIGKLTDFVYDYIFPDNDILNTEGETEMLKFDNVTQEKEVWVRLTKLAVLSEEKYGQEHPELKNGDCVDICDYLSCLFETLVSAGVTFPPAHVGDIIYVLQPYEAEDPVVCEIEVHGVSMIETVWHVCDKDYRFVPIRPEYCFRSKEDAEACLQKLLGGDTVG